MSRVKLSIYAPACHLYHFFDNQGIINCIKSSLPAFSDFASRNAKQSLGLVCGCHILLLLYTLSAIVRYEMAAGVPY